MSMLRVAVAAWTWAGTATSTADSDAQALIAATKRPRPFIAPNSLDDDTIFSDSRHFLMNPISRPTEFGPFAPALISDTSTSKSR